MRDKFKARFMAEVDARYLAPKDAYKMYFAGLRGETVRTSKFIKVIGPILKKTLAPDDNERECIREVTPNPSLTDATP